MLTHVLINRSLQARKVDLGLLGEETVVEDMIRVRRSGRLDMLCTASVSPWKQLRFTQPHVQLGGMRLPDLIFAFVRRMKVIELYDRKAKVDEIMTEFKVRL